MVAGVSGVVRPHVLHKKWRFSPCWLFTEAAAGEVCCDLQYELCYDGFCSYVSGVGPPERFFFLNFLGGIKDASLGCLMFGMYG